MSGCFDRGILSEAGDGDSVLNLTVTGNTIDQQVGTLAREAIQTNHGITSTNVFGNVDTNAVCLQLSANTFSHGGAVLDDFRLRKRFEATVRLPGYAGGTGQDPVSSSCRLHPGSEHRQCRRAWERVRERRGWRLHRRGGLPAAAVAGKRCATLARAGSRLSTTLLRYE